LNFNDNNNYTISHATNRITMDVTGGNAQINVSNSGSPTISAGLTLNDALVINQNSTGTLTLSASNAITGTNRNLTINGAGDTVVSGTITTGTGTLTKNNSGTLTLSGVNTFTGATTINGGTVAISAETGLGSNPGTLATGHLTLNGGTLRTQTSAVAINDSRRGITIGASGGTIETVTDLTIGQADSTRNVLTMTGTLTKTGAGTLTLLGDSVNTGNGAVNIAGGALTLSKSPLVSAIGDTAAVTVGAGATLNLNAPECHLQCRDRRLDCRCRHDRQRRDLRDFHADLRWRQHLHHV
jgi:fibronectin-binding autotransporter adhesin